MNLATIISAANAIAGPSGRSAPARFGPRWDRIMPRGCLPSQSYPRRLRKVDAYGCHYEHTIAGIRRLGPLPIAK